MVNDKRSYLIDITVLTLMLSAFFLVLLGNMPLHTPDEARYSLVSFQLFQNHEYLVPKINGVGFLDKPPLFYYAQMLMLKLFGNSEMALRLPSTLASVFSCIMLYVTARKLFDRTTAWYSALLLANFPLFFLMSHYANLDMLVASLIHTSLCFFILSINSTRPRRLLWAAYVSMALAMLTKGLIAVAFPCCIIFLYCAIYRIKPKLYLCDGALIFSLFVLPWFIKMHFEVEGFSYYYFVIQHFYRYLSQSFNNQQPFWFYGALVMASSLPFSVFSKRVSWSMKNPATGFFVINFLFILLFFSIPSSKPIGYILPAFPPLALLLARSMSHQFKEQPFVGLAIASIIIGLLFCYPWLALRTYYHEITPIALMVAMSGCAGLLIQLYFASPTQPSQQDIMRRQRCFVSLICVTMMCLNINGLQFAQSLEHESIKPIVRYLKNNDTKNTPIAMYHTFYYDLPYYSTKRTIYAVDAWKKGLFKGDLLTEQFALGMQYNAPNTFISNTDFMRRWDQLTQPIYVVTNEHYSRALLEKHGQLVFKYRGTYLLINKP